MNNKKINIIHPKDETTDFLEEIYKYVSENTGAVINLLRLETREEHLSFFKIIHEFDVNDLNLFLGHGTSFGLSGADTKDYSYSEFVTFQQLKVFENKKVILLSCRSNEYLDLFFKECNIKEAIGYPNLITDFIEIENHDYPERVEDVKEYDIEAFKSAIVEIVKFSLEDYINNELSIYQLYNRLKLRTNKRIIKLYQKSPNNGKLPLGKMLNDMVEGINYFQNHSN